MIVTGTILKIGSNLPYANANVNIKNAPISRGVQANSKGEYKIDVTIGETLVFTHVSTDDIFEQRISSMFDNKVDVYLIEEKSLPQITISNTVNKKNNDWLYWLLAGGICYGIYKIATQKQPLKVKI